MVLVSFVTYKITAFRPSDAFIPVSSPALIVLYTNKSCMLPVWYNALDNQSKLKIRAIAIVEGVLRALTMFIVYKNILV